MTTIDEQITFQDIFDIRHLQATNTSIAAIQSWKKFIVLGLGLNINC